MLGKMILALFVAWLAIIITTWRFLKRRRQPDEVHGPNNRRFVLVCHYCGCIEETDATFGLNSTDKWPKFACTKCKGEGKNAGNNIDRASGGNGS